MNIIRFPILEVFSAVNKNTKPLAEFSQTCHLSWCKLRIGSLVNRQFSKMSSTACKKTSHTTTRHACTFAEHLLEEERFQHIHPRKSCLLHDFWGRSDIFNLVHLDHGKRSS
eukprot:Pompholyxophrys_punicea_v1_NODE_321_length_2256_cov_7.715129.p2 type:complete len:112 gc:universal NODE_321_length_2256_cov_7.715129:345-680(+)